MPKLRCYISGLMRDDLARMVISLDYLIESSHADRGQFGSDYIQVEKIFATKAEFLAEHKRVVDSAKSIMPSAGVKSEYFITDDGPPEYEEWSE